MSVRKTSLGQSKKGFSYYPAEFLTKLKFNNAPESQLANNLEFPAIPAKIREILRQKMRFRSSFSKRLQKN